MKTLLILLIWVLFPVISFAQEYKDLFSDKRAPYRFRVYEREVLKANEIEKIDTLNVWKYLNVVWMQGHYKFEGDTTKLIFKYWQRDLDLRDPLGKIIYPAYIYMDTIYKEPTIEGFLEWKKERGFK